MYEIKDETGILYGTGKTMEIANLFAQALREKYRGKDFKVQE